jgi:hypothetical protein
MGSLLPIYGKKCSKPPTRMGKSSINDVNDDRI